MKKMLLAAAAAAAAVVAAASPALAQPHHDWPLAHSRGVTIYGPNYNPYYDYYAWPPGWYHGHPSPYAQYDQNGHLFDENMPGRD
jgi:opacity protein-like surface antigen